MTKDNPFSLDFKVTRYSDDSDLTDWDYAFIFDKDGKIRNVQLPFWLDDAETLPDNIAKLIEIVSTMPKIRKDTFH